MKNGFLKSVSSFQLIINSRCFRHILDTFLRFQLPCFIFAITVSLTTYCYAVERQTVRDNGLVGTYYCRSDSLQQPPVIFFGGSSGGNFYDKYQNYAEDLVDLGYAVLNLAYFDFNSNGDLPHKLHHIPLEYFRKAMDWMENQPQTSKGRFAVIGNSRGSEAALLLGIHFPEIAAVVAVVPSAYVGGAFDRKSMVTGSAWTFEGKEIPYVDYQKAISNYEPWWKIIDDTEEVEPFAIPVEKLSAAVLFLSGERDKIWPSTEMSKRMIQRLEKNKYKFPFQHISYDAGHNIRVESWPDLLRFLKRYYPR